MATRNEPCAPDLVNPSGTMTLLESTGVRPEAGTPELLEELAELTDTLDPVVAAKHFLGPDRPGGVHRWAAFICAHLYDGDAPRSIERPPWTKPTGMRGRPLLGVEQAMCRVTAERWDPDKQAVSSAQYAIAEASATSGELIRLTIDDVTVTGLATVHLGGGRDQLPRDTVLDEWGTRAVIRRLDVVAGRGPSTPFVYDGTEPGTNKAQASASGNLKRVLDAAGLGQDPTLNPTSIRNTYAQRLHDDGERLEVIAAAMGAKSLDRVWRLVATPAPS